MFPAIQFHLEVCEECTSTNDELLGLRERGDFHGLALLARRQTAGHGRRERSWWSAPDNLTFSVGFHFESIEHVSLLPFTAGIAMMEVLEKLIPGRAHLKWPNDIYIDGKKFAGLLAHSRQQGSVVDTVIGIGANLSEAPPSDMASVEAVALSEFIAPPSPKEFAQAMLASWEKVLRIQSFAELKGRWESFARLEKPIFVVGEGEPLRAIGILETGELEVESQRGERRKLSSEEVSLRF